MLMSAWKNSEIYFPSFTVEEKEEFAYRDPSGNFFISELLKRGFQLISLVGTINIQGTWKPPT